MKAYIVIFKHFFDVECIVNILGIYSTKEKAINKIDDFVSNELESIYNNEFKVMDLNDGSIKVFNENDEFDNIWLAYEEIEIDTDTILNILNVI